MVYFLQCVWFTVFAVMRHLSHMRLYRRRFGTLFFDRGVFFIDTSLPLWQVMSDSYRLKIHPVCRPSALCRDYEKVFALFRGLDGVGPRRMFLPSRSSYQLHRVWYFSSTITYGSFTRVYILSNIFFSNFQMSFTKLKIYRFDQN